jgi:hypothetical protein
MTNTPGRTRSKNLSGYLKSCLPTSTMPANCKERRYSVRRRLLGSLLISPSLPIYTDNGRAGDKEQRAYPHLGYVARLIHLFQV